MDNSRSIQRSISKNGSMNKNSVIPTGGMTRMANSQVVRITPKPFSPFYEESNLMLPRDRREVNAWSRHYYSTDPWVGNAIDLHSTYPLSAFGVKSSDPTITKFFNQMLDRLNFSSIIYDIGKEFNIIGEVFPYAELDLNIGEWSKIIIQNPDYIEVKSNVLTTSMISLIPDDELKRLVTSTNPDDVVLRGQIDPEVLAYVYAGKNIPLSQRYVSHLARKNSPYDVRGTSILTRVFKDLMLRDKYREAQFSIADNHITPLKIFKVGTADGTYRPTSDDLVAFREMLEQATYDPNFTLVTHPGLEVQYVGSTGVILPLDGEMDRIEDRVLTGLFTSKAFTHSEGPCLTSDTETLTKDGFKLYHDITENDEIATVNPDSGNLEFHKYTGRVKFDIDGEIINFKNKSIDHAVSLNHKVWIRDTGKNKTYRKIRADEVKAGYRFKTHMGWNGKTDSHIAVGSRNIPINDYMLLVGLYLSEGSVYFNNNKPNGITISQAKYHKLGLNERYDIIKEILERNYKVSELLAKRREYMAVGNTVMQQDISFNSEGFLIADHELGKHLSETFGHGSVDKNIPSYIKEYSKEILQSLLDGYNLGDESKLNNHTESYEICTISKKMADDLQEIAIKCGYISVVKERIRPESRKKTYRVQIYLRNLKNKMYEPRVSKNDIKRLPYKGWIYCFEVPNHLFVVRRNGMITVTGNTYANASVALEVLQQRYVAFRTLIEKWLEIKIFRPICKLQGFEKIVGGKTELIIPKVNWDKINLKNNREYQQAVENLVKEGKASVETLLKTLDLSLDEEVEQMNREIPIFKEIGYKQELPYDGPENINVSENVKKDQNKAGPEKKAPEEGGGLDFGGDLGGDMNGDIGGEGAEGAEPIGLDALGDIGGETASAPGGETPAI